MPADIVDSAWCPSQKTKDREDKAMSSATLYRRMCFGVIAVAFQVVATTTAHAQTTVGGHVGVLVPWITWAGGENGQTTTVFDYWSIGLPFGVTVRGQSRVFVDFEFVPAVTQIPHLTHETTLTVDPGVLYRLDHGFTIGLRAAFDIDSSRVGFIPLVNKSWKLSNQNGFFKTFFAELDLPVKFSRPPGGPATNPVTLATQFGFGF
jgi:hypothetical protein